MKKLLISLLLLSGFGLVHGYGYEHTVKNLSNRPAWVEVKYAGCSNDGYPLNPGQSRTINAGFCIVNAVEASVEVRRANGDEEWVEASSYKGPYTGSSTWLVVPDGNGFMVTRKVQ